MRRSWLLIVLFSISLGFGLNELTAKESKALPPIPADLLPSEKNTIEIFRQAAPLVVFVHNLRTYSGFFSVEEVQQGTGSGFIWDDKGHIVTNYHVVQGADNVAITLQNGDTLDATIVNAEPRKDIAILKVNPKKIPKNGFSQKIANSAELIVGQKAIAIGNPFGLDHTLTSGIVSALGRSFPGADGVTIRDMIQTDAAINPGNSGGPLLNSKGELIGMNTAIYSNSGSSAGIGFAVPSNTISRIANQIIKYGEVIQAGIGIYQVPERFSRYYDIQGVIILDVVKGGPADKAGLQGSYRDRRGRPYFGDIIVGIDDAKVRDYDDIYNALESRKVGEKVTVHYIRDGKKRKARVKLEKINSSRFGR